MNSVKKIKPYFLLILLVVFCIFKIENVLLGMQKALSICGFSIIPSLFIFFVLSDITVSMIYRDSFALSPKFILFLLGSLCGFPIGASLCETMYQNKVLNKQDAEKLLPFCNIASPAFVIGAVGVTMFKNEKIGILLYFSQAVVCALPMLFVKCKNEGANIKSDKKSFSQIYFSSLEKAVNSILKVCAQICIFTVFLSLIEHCALKYLAVFSEVTCALSLCSNIFSYSPFLSIAIGGFSLGFSCFCVHGQIISSVKSFKINYLRFLSVKALQGVMTALLSTILYYLFFCA